MNMAEINAYDVIVVGAGNAFNSACLSGNYLGGAGLMSGSVFGRQSGKSASEFARAEIATA
jgi:hypothetical protein